MLRPHMGKHYSVCYIFSDIGQCPCDLTGNACDVNCCCDSDCTTTDIEAFSGCLPESHTEGG